MQKGNKYPLGRFVKKGVQFYAGFLKLETETTLVLILPVVQCCREMDEPLQNISLRSFFLSTPERLERFMTFKIMFAPEFR